MENQPSSRSGGRLTSEDLKNRAAELGRPLVVPLLGYPGIQLTHSTIKQNEFNFGLHFWTIYELVQRFQPDAIFTLMDLSLEANALGMPVRYPLEESATVEYHLVGEASDLQQFMALDPLKDGRVMTFLETMRLMSSSLDIPKGAYVIGPFTLAGLLMGANDIAMATLTDRETVNGVLEFCLGTILRYSRALEAAGCDMIAILEPTAVMLSPRQFWEFSGRFVQRLIGQLSSFPILHICGNSSHLIDAMVKTGARGLSLDSLVNLPELALKVPGDIFLIGNLDPVAVMLQKTPAQIHADTRTLLQSMSPFDNFILSTGCDLPMETPLENIDAFMQAGTTWRRN